MTGTDPAVQAARLAGDPKWLLAIPHDGVLFFLDIAAFFVVIAAWYAIVITRRYPRGMFGVRRGSCPLERPGHRPRAHPWSPTLPAIPAGHLNTRTSSKERQLTQALGAEHQRFAADRKRLVPGVW